MDRLTAMAFVLDRKVAAYTGPRTYEETADVLAKACGHGGSGAEYLHNTVVKLAEHGIHDRNLWALDRLVAERIRSLAAARIRQGLEQASLRRLGRRCRLWRNSNGIDRIKQRRIVIGDRVDARRDRDRREQFVRRGSQQRLELVKIAVRRKPCVEILRRDDERHAVVDDAEPLVRRDGDDRGRVDLAAVGAGPRLPKSAEGDQRRIGGADRSRAASAPCRASCHS